MTHRYAAVERLRPFLRGSAQLALLVAIQLQAAGVAQSAPVPVSAQIEVSLVATSWSNQDVRTDSLSVSFPASSASLDVEALASENGDTARAYETINATFEIWRGSLDLDFGIEIQNADLDTNNSAQVGGHDAWIYTFVPDEDAVLLFAYDVGGSANLTFESTGTTQEQESVYGTGTIRRDLVADTSMTLRIYMPSGPSCFGSCNTTSSGYGYFNWAIVPEPATASLVAAGLVALGLSRRGRSRLRP